MRYVDNTMLSVKEKDIALVQERLNSFDKKTIIYSADTFEDGKVHFLDIEIAKSKKNVYHKLTSTGQYINFRSHKPWILKPLG